MPYSTRFMTCTQQVHPEWKPEGGGRSVLATEEDCSRDLPGGETESDQQGEMAVESDSLCGEPLREACGLIRDLTLAERVALCLSLAVSDDPRQAAMEPNFPLVHFPPRDLTCPHHLTWGKMTIYELIIHLSSSQHPLSDSSIVLDDRYLNKVYISIRDRWLYPSLEAYHRILLQSPAPPIPDRFVNNGYVLSMHHTFTCSVEGLKVAFLTNAFLKGLWHGCGKHGDRLFRQFCQNFAPYPERCEVAQYYVDDYLNE